MDETLRLLDKPGCFFFRHKIPLDGIVEKIYSGEVCNTMTVTVLPDITKVAVTHHIVMIETVNHQALSPFPSPGPEAAVKYAYSFISPDVRPNCSQAASYP